MRSRKELLQLIESARKELDEALLRGEKFEIYYPISIRIDQLIEEYVDLNGK